MTKIFSTTAAVIGTALAVLSAEAIAHNSLTSFEGYAGYRHETELLITHGCKGSPVNEVRIKIPDSIVSASAHHDPDWEIEYQMRKLDEPFRGEGGIMVSEVVDTIIWKNPKESVPNNMYRSFRFRVGLPKEVNKVVHFQSINICENGERDPYVDMPEAELNVNAPDFKEQAWKFMTATATPAPFLVTRQPPKPQYPWEWNPEQAAGEPSQQKASAE
ncbi:MAG: DUF1775 domain-containing protein [Rhodospirillaceae bacterium]